MKIRLFVHLILIGLSLVSYDVLAQSNCRQEVGNAFVPFIGEYRTVRVNNSTKNNQPYDVHIAKVVVAYETANDVTPVGSLFLKVWSGPNVPEIRISEHLFDGETIKGDGKKVQEIVGLDDGAKFITRFSNPYYDVKDVFTLRRNANGSFVFSYEISWQDGILPADIVFVELVLEKA
jgi:hypothetical protein